MAKVRHSEYECKPQKLSHFFKPILKNYSIAAVNTAALLAKRRSPKAVSRVDVCLRAPGVRC